MQEGEKEVGVHHVAMNFCEGGKVKASVKDRHMNSINVLYISPYPTSPPPLLCQPLSDQTVAMDWSTRDDTAVLSYPSPY